MSDELGPQEVFFARREAVEANPKEILLRVLRTVDELSGEVEKLFPEWLRLARQSEDVVAQLRAKVKAGIHHGGEGVVHARDPARIRNVHIYTPRAVLRALR